MSVWGHPTAIIVLCGRGARMATSLTRFIVYGEVSIVHRLRERPMFTPKLRQVETSSG